MAAVTDYFIKGPANHSTTLSSSINDSVQTIPLSDVTGVPTDTAVYIAVDAHDANGNATPSDAEVIKGVISGSNLINASRGAEGTAQAHDSGAVVEFFFTAAANNDIVDGLLVSHDQDGTLKAGAVDDSSVIANDVVNSQHYAAGSIDLEHMSANSVDSDQYVDGSIDTAHLADASVTPDKRSGGVVTGLLTGPTLGTTGNKAVTGVGFTPTSVEFHFSGSATGDPAGSTVRQVNMYGIMTATTQFVTSGSASETDGARYSSDEACIAIPTSVSNSTPALLAVFVSMDADGFTINVTTALSTHGIWWVARR